MYDLVDDLAKISKAVGCYVTERKNKEAIAVSESVAHDVERTSICAWLNRSLRNWHDHPELCQPVYLRRARIADNRGQLLRSEEALLPCGTVYKDDLVVMSDGSVGKVEEFFEVHEDEDVFVRVSLYAVVEGKPLHYKPYPVEVSSSFFSVDDLVEAVSYYKVDGDAVIVTMPLFEL